MTARHSLYSAPYPPMCGLVAHSQTNRADAGACQTVAERGVGIVATVHGDSIFAVIDNPELNGIFGGVETVQLGDMEARAQARANRKDRMDKVRREPRGPPFFHVVVELRSWTSWTVYPKVDRAFVAAVLNGEPVSASVRTLNANNTVEMKDRMVTPKTT
jgi:hypothetical protein